MRYRPIRRNSEFGRVYARGKSYVNPALVLYVLKTRGKKTRVGLTATKKIGHAVQRNRARRVMKAAIDEHLDYNMLVFFSPAGIDSLLKNFPDFDQKKNGIRIGCYGKHTCDAAEAVGLTVDLAAPSATAPSMTSALDEYLAKKD